MKKSVLTLFTLLLTFFVLGQNDTLVRKHKIAVFAPLYLDSAYDANNEYRYAKKEFPKFINPGLEFYEGIQLALDSLNKEKAPLEVFIYDTRSASATLLEQLNQPELDDVELMITHCSSAEVKIFADAGLKKNVPVINANLPFDGNVTSNPFYVMLNSTLRTQCEGIYKHIQKYYAQKPIIVLRKKGLLEDMIKSHFDDFGKNTLDKSLTFKYVELTDSFTLNQLRPLLDTTKETLCIGGSLDENFGKRLAQQLAGLKKMKYQSMVMGMPTWDNIREFHKPEYKGLEIIYATPFYNPRTDKISVRVTEYFNRVMFARPSDMVLRGYEVMWKFAKLLMNYKSDFASSVTHKEYNLFRDFDIQPVINRQSKTLDYFENQKLYFLKWQDGVIKSVN